MTTRKVHPAIRDRADEIEEALYRHIVKRGDKRTAVAMLVTAVELFDELGCKRDEVISLFDELMQPARTAQGDTRGT